MALAVADENAVVRGWVARRGYLRVAEGRSVLEADADEYVRAAVWENPNVSQEWQGHEWWLEHFRVATHLERLAMVRNPYFDDLLIETILDPADRTLGLSRAERDDLVHGYLTNETALTGRQFDDGAREHFKELWRLASKWPDVDLELGVRYMIYRHVSADDKTKAAAYKSCCVTLRKAILRNDTPPVHPYGDELAKLAVKDENAECRDLARKKLHPAEAERRRLTSTLSLGWSIVIGSVIFILAYMLFGAATSRFETVVIALFILTYNLVWSISQVRWLGAREESVLASTRYLHLLELLKDPTYSGDRKDEVQEGLRKQAREDAKVNRRLIVQAVLEVALLVMALLRLAGAIL
jgi:hypothetical protein